MPQPKKRPPDPSKELALVAGELARLDEEAAQARVSALIEQGTLQEWDARIVLAQASIERKQLATQMQSGSRQDSEGIVE